MREAVKSILGCSLAFSMFGVQQISKLMAGSAGQPQKRTAAEFDEVSLAVQTHLFGAQAMQFRMGDEWQRRLVDTVFDVTTLRSVDPRHVVSSLDPRTLINTAGPRKIVETGATLFKRSVDAVKNAVMPTAVDPASEL